MTYHPESILLNQHKLSYRVYSGGEKYLFVFHGYGQTPDIFETLIPTILTDYTVVAIELFFHGNSEVLEKNKNYISIAEWNELFGAILKRHEIYTFSMLSFSIGSRFIFAVLHAYSNQVERLALIAPDGFGNTFWFRLATSNVLCRWVFKCVLTYPLFIIYFVRFFDFIGVINGATSNFIQKSLQSKKERERIYNTWVYFRKLNIQSKKIIHAINTNAIKVFFATGSKDDLVAQRTIKDVSDRVGAQYMDLPFAHTKMAQAIHSDVLRAFLVADR